MFLISISPSVSDVEYIFEWLLAIYILYIFFGEGLIVSLLQFSNWNFFYYWVLKLAYSIYMSLFIDMLFANFSFGL